MHQAIIHQLHLGTQLGKHIHVLVSLNIPRYWTMLECLHVLTLWVSVHILTAQSTKWAICACSFWGAICSAVWSSLYTTSMYSHCGRGTWFKEHLHCSWEEGTLPCTKLQSPSFNSWVQTTQESHVLWVYALVKSEIGMVNYEREEIRNVLRGQSPWDTSNDYQPNYNNITIYKYHIVHTCMYACYEM